MLVLLLQTLLLITFVTGATLDKSGAIGSPCAGGSRDGKCNSNLVCLDGFCACPRGQVWDRLTEDCRLAAEEPLNELDSDVTLTITECVRNSVMESVPGDGHDGEGGHQWCKCAPGYNASETGLCHASYNGKCVFMEDCAPDRGLHCVEGVCHCRDYGYFWDAGRATCLAYVGSKCGEKGNTTAPCVETTHCDPVEGICKCDGAGEGFEATSDRRSCYKPLGYGAPCRPGQCNRQKQLTCVDEVCMCSGYNSMRYDEAEQKCVYVSDGQCGVRKSTKQEPKEIIPEYKFVACNDEAEAVLKMRYGSKEWTSFCVRATKVPPQSRSSQKIRDQFW